MFFLLCLQISEPIFTKKTSYILSKEVLSFFNLSKFEPAVLQRMLLPYPLFTSTCNQPQYSSKFWNLEKCQVSRVTKIMAPKTNTKYCNINVAQLVLYYFVLRLFDSELYARSNWP